MALLKLTLWSAPKPRHPRRGVNLSQTQLLTGWSQGRNKPGYNQVTLEESKTAQPSRGPTVRRRSVNTAARDSWWWRFTLGRWFPKKEKKGKKQEKRRTEKAGVNKICCCLVARLTLLQPHGLPARFLRTWDFPGIMEWVAFFFSRGYSQHRDQTCTSCSLLAGRFFTTEPPGKTLIR